MKITKSFLFLFAGIFMLSNLALIGQVITADPPLPTEADQVVITFDATKGTGGLANYTGDVYAHTGVITDKSTSGSDWKYVKAGWTTNIPACKMTRISTNIYQLTIGPSIRSFYGVLAGDKILKLAFVFRSSDGSKEGKDVNGTDIYYTVYEAGLNISITQPTGNFTLTTAGGQVSVAASFTSADSAAIFIDGKKSSYSITSPITSSFSTSDNIRHTIIARAWKNAESVSDTTYVMVPGTPASQPLPAGVKDGINYIDDQSVTLVLFAPYKNNVFLIGDFNNWIPDNSYLMNKDGDRFWITISGLTSKKEYLFQYLIDGNLRIADPYCDKISDPMNDKYIPDYIYPNLIHYPEGKTSEIAGVFQTAQDPYQWDTTHFTPPPTKNLVIYELLVRDFTGQEDFKTAADSIHYLKNLGINAIELMPVSEFEGNDSWGYNPSFYFAPDKAYGTKYDLKQFIDLCHKNGIAVIMDIVLNHSYGSSPMVRMYFDGTKPTAQNPWYNQSSPNTSYSWGYDFNHESPATKAFVDRVTSYWLTEYHMDGFRFDFSKGFTNTVGDGWAYDASRIAILERIANKIWSVNPSAYVILEHFTDNTEEKQLSAYGMMLWGNLNTAYNEATMGYNESGKSDFSSVSYKARSWTDPHLVGYMESHDEERLMYKNLTYGNSIQGGYDIKFYVTALERMELANAFFLTIPGPKMIWQFGELGYDYSINYNGRVGKKPVRWDYFHEITRYKLYRVVGMLAKLKETEPVFSTTDFSLNVNGAVKEIFLNGIEDTVIIAGNFGISDTEILLSFPHPGTWYSYFNSDSITVTGSSYTLPLQAGEYKLLSTKKFAGFGSINVGNKPTNNPNALSLYPNPVDDVLTLSVPDQLSWVGIYDIAGRCIFQEKKSLGNTEINCRNLRQGTYLIHYQTISGSTGTGKFIVMH